MFKRTLFKRALFASALAISLTGCMVGPKYHPPQSKVDPAFGNAATPAPPAGAQAAATAATYGAGEPVAAFWTVFNDPLLTRLVTDSLTANHEVRQAMARLREARALRRDSKYDLFPQTSVNAGYSATRSSKDSIPFPTTSDQRRIELFETGFDSSWELDIFGRVRHAVDARTAEAEATAFDLRGVQVSVSAEVARSYYELRALQRQLEVAQQNADNQRQTLEITQVRLDAGRGTAFDTERARTQLESTRATIPALEAQVAATMHRIAVLTGRQPTALVQDLAAPKATVPASASGSGPASGPAQTASQAETLPTSVDVGSPEMLLRRRPDIQSAERRLAEQTALVGVAVGDLFPKVTFNAGFGIGGETPADLAAKSAFRYGIGPSITWPAFNIGRVRARITASEARTDGALARYEQTVLVAIEEVETSLVAYDRARVRRERLLEAAQASERAADLARTRFEGGLSDFLQVLDAERTRLESQEQVARSLGETTTSLVAVYKALGGGWTAQPPTSTQP
jgi:multidrug efflux system outer membrane protein